MNPDCRRGSLRTQTTQPSSLGRCSLIFLSSCGVFLAERIVRIADVLLARHAVGARLTMPDRSTGSGPEPFTAVTIRMSRSAPSLPDHHNQSQHRHRQKNFRISILPLSVNFSLSHSLRNLDRIAIASTLRRTILCLADIGHGAEQPDPAATSTTKKPSITAFSKPRLPSFSGGSGRHCHPRPSRFRRIEVNVAAIIDDTIARFRMLFTCL